MYQLTIEVDYLKVELILSRIHGNICALKHEYNHICV